MLCEKENLGFYYSDVRDQRSTYFRSEYNNHIEKLGKKES